MKIAFIAVTALLGGCADIRDIANKPLAQVTLWELTKYVGLFVATCYLAFVIYCVWIDDRK